MTITKREVQPKARITYDEMEAFLTLPVPKEGEEYTYDGQWKNDAPYGVVHRITSSGKVKGAAGDFKKNAPGEDLQ